MDPTTRTRLNHLLSDDREAHNRAYQEIIAETEQPVPWAEEAWDEIAAALRHKDNQVRSIASQVLCNLAKSDPGGRILRDFDALLAVTRDERFVTARHCLQSMWKIGLAGEPQRRRVVEGLSQRFHEAAEEKNGTLIRYDITVGLHQLYDQTGDESVRAAALALIELEADPKYSKKYAAEWRGAKG
jgi:hypothetical protein